MLGRIQRVVAMLLTLALTSSASPLASAQSSGQAQAGQAQSGDFILKANAELVLTNVVARDTKTGELIRGLKQTDFSVYENGKQQQISSFDFQSVDMAAPLNEATISGLAAGATQQRQQSRRSGPARGPAQPSPHRDVLRPDLHAA